MQQPAEIATLAGALDDMSARGFIAQFVLAGGLLHISVADPAVGRFMHGVALRRGATP